MAKKKKAKKKTAKRKPRRKPKIDPQRLLLAKINRIKERVPHIDPTGECRDPETQELLFRFTEAQHVFDIYRTECEIEGLIYRPYADASIQPKAIAIGSMPLIIGTFCIEDIRTGAKIIGWGSGMGANRDWSGNTANTRALKQFLLTTFEANWQDPENPNQNKDQLRAQVIQELEQDGTLARIEEIKFFAQTLGRKGKADASIKRSDSKNRGRTGDKKTRTGAKRNPRRSR